MKFNTLLFLLWFVPFVSCLRNIYLFKLQKYSYFSSTTSFLLSFMFPSVIWLNLNSVYFSYQYLIGPHCLLKQFSSPLWFYLVHMLKARRLDMCVPISEFFILFHQLFFKVASSLIFIVLPIFYLLIDFKYNS